jgi:23S rRNA (pseudouridine1915-N3)-methyltransferase
VKLVVAAVGKLKDRGLRDLVDDYLGRLRHYVPIEELEVRDAAGFSKIHPEALRIALEVDGRALSSATFARKLESWGSTGKGIVAFMIGGAEGLPKDLSDAAHAKLSLSTMTLPHRLARLLLAEQLYRAMTILRNEPYAREG